MKNLRIIEPRIKHYDYKKKRVLIRLLPYRIVSHGLLAKSKNEVGSMERNVDLDRGRCVFSY